MLTADEARALLDHELVQRQEEGCNTDGWAARIERVRRSRRPQAVLAVYDALARLRPKPSLARNEPSDLTAIRKLRPRGPRTMRHRLSDVVVRDRLRGAFLGRCAGCLLGKPVEGWLHDRIRRALEADHRYPLRDYIPRSTILRDDPKRTETPWVRETITCMARDDDIDYTILGIHIVRTHGGDFTTRHVADEWLGRLPYNMTYTAEHVAYRNLVEGRPLEEVPLVYNPFREWIGAQIRADGFAYCAPGRPQLVAEFAHRDAALSHVKNGIYGEMLFAAMIAAAAVCDDLDEVIDIGLSEIPARCRLAEAVRDTIAWSRANGDDWHATFDAIHAKYGRYHTVHTINNAAVVIMALLHGRYDFGRTICLAVMGGWDTDCNGATAGSVLGAILGTRRLPARWIRPLRNRLESCVAGYDGRRITDLADEAMEISRSLRRRS